MSMTLDFAQEWLNHSTIRTTLTGILYDHGVWIGDPDSGLGWVIPSDLHPGQEYNGKRVTITLTVDENG